MVRATQPGDPPRAGHALGEEEDVPEVGGTGVDDVAAEADMAADEEGLVESSGGAGAGLTNDDVLKMLKSEETNLTRGLMIPKLDHNKMKYQEWETQFKSFAGAKGFLAGLTKSKYLPKCEGEILVNMNPMSHYQREKARMANNVAMAYLMQALSNKLD